jgi:hypothetical protein
MIYLKIIINLNLLIQKLKKNRNVKRDVTFQWNLKIEIISHFFQSTIFSLPVEKI